MTTLAIAAIQIGAGLLLNALFPPPGQNVEGPRLNDLAVSGSSYGEPWPIPYGVTRHPTNMLWNQAITEVKLEEEVGKGGGGGTITSYEYFGDFALGVCDGPIDRIMQMYADGKLIYDATGTGKVLDVYEGVEEAALFKLQLTTSISGSTAADPAIGGLAANTLGAAKAPLSQLGLPVRFYNGDEAQVPDPLIESDKGVGNVSAHRGLCYIVFEKLPLKNFGNRVPNITVTIAVDADNTIIRQGPTTIGAIANTDMRFDRRRRRLVLGDVTQTSRWSYDDLTQRIINTDSRLGVVAGVKLALSRSGDVYFVTGSDLDEPVRKYDGTSLQEVAVSTDEFSIPITDIMGVTVTNVGLLKETLNFVFVAPNQGGLSIFRDLGTTLTEITTAGFDNLIAGNDLSAAGAVGGNMAEDPLNQVVYIMQDWTTSSIDPTGPHVLWRIRLNALQLSGGVTGVQPDAEEVFRFPRNDGVNGFPGASGVGTLFYVKGDNSLIIQGGGHTIKFDLNTSTIVARNTTLPTFGPGMRDSLITGGVFAFAEGDGVSGNFYEVSVNSLAVIRTTSIDTVESFSVVGNNIFDEETFSITTDKNGLTRYFLNRAEGNGQPLSTIVQDLCVRAGLLTTDIDVTDLAGITVKGFTANRQSTARRHIEALMQGFLFDMVEEDDKLVAKLRGKPSVRTLSLDDLGELRDDEGLPDPTRGRVVEDRVQEVELPRRIFVTHTDEDRDYQKGTQLAQRVSNPGKTMFSDGDRTFDLPIVFNATEAKQLAEKWLYSFWLGRSKFKTTTHWGNIDLSVTDVVDLPLPSRTRTARITQMDVGANLVVDLELQEEDSSAFSAVSSADDGFGFIRQQLPASSLTEVFFLDVPLLKALDASGGLFSRAYLAMNGFADNWPGGTLSRSADDINFVEVSTSFEGVPWGTVSVALPAPVNNRIHVFDDVNTITFYAERGDDQFTSKTDLLVLNGENAVLLGKEIVQFVDATLNVDGSLTLSRLLRGRLGTDQHIGTHVLGERLVMLRTDVVVSQKLPLSDIGTALLYKAVTVSHLLETSDEERFTYTGIDLTPYSPSILLGVRSGTDLDISWRRRTRYNRPELVGTAPLNEVAELYDLELRHRGVLLRTLTDLTVPSHQYTLANWTTDTGLGDGQYVVDNGDFEQGSDVGWIGLSSVTPGRNFRTLGSQGTITAPQAGALFAACIETLFNSATMSQDIDLLVDWHLTVEELRLEPSYTVQGYTAQGIDADDEMRLRFLWKDESDVVVKTDSTDFVVQAADGVWVLRQFTGTVPKDARKITIEFLCRKVGSAADKPNGALDSVTVAIGTGVPKVEATVFQLSEAVGRGFQRKEIV